MLEKTFRITPNPVKQCKNANNDIDIEYIKNTFIKNPKYTKFIIAREYNNINDKFSLHYHGYFLTVYSKNTVRTNIKNMCKKQYKGNEYVSIKQDDIGEYAKNYICKDDDIVCYKGFTKKDIENYIKEGKEYKDKKKLYKMNWIKRLWYYIEKKGYKDKLIKKFNSHYYFNIENNLLPIVMAISSDLDINPPPPHIYQNLRMSVLRVLFPNAFRQWYISYIEESIKFKGEHYLVNIKNKENEKKEFDDNSLKPMKHHNMDNFKTYVPYTYEQRREMRKMELIEI